MSDTILADGKNVLLFRHQEIQENLNVDSPELLLQLLKEKCLTREQCGQLFAFGRTPQQKINLLLSYLLKSNSDNPLRNLICSLKSTPDYEPHQKLAAILSASNNIQTPHLLMPLKVNVEILKKKEELCNLIDIQALLPLLNKQQLLSVSEYCAIVDTESQTLRVDLLLKFLQRHPDGVSKLVHCLREDKTNPLEHSELANFITELDGQPLHVKKEPVTPVTSLMKKLKKRYRERRVKLHSQWPPMLNQKIVEPRLVLTETENSSIESTDGPISLDYKALFKNDTHERKVRKVVVLGEAGVGKSTFCEKLLSDWGEDTDTLSEYQLVFFASLHMKEAASSKSLNDFLSHNYSELGDSVGQYLGDGEGCLFILDGWDELPDSQLNEVSIFHDLLSDKCLPFASVIVTSRTTASRDLYKMPSIDRFATLQGFSEKDIERFVKSKFISPEQSAALLRQFSDNPVLESLCTNPLNCVILCDLWKSKGKDIPLKATGLYTQIIFSIVHREAGRNFPQYKGATCLEELLPLMQSLCHLAFTGLKRNRTAFTMEEIEGKLDFTSKDLPIVFQSLGLLQSTCTFTAVDCSLSFKFNNVTFQEYLAAWYLLSLSVLEQIAASQQLFKVPRFQKVWQFYFGLQCRKVIPEGVISKCLKSHISSDNYKIHLCRCAYEADSNIVNDIVAANINGEFESYGKLSAYDCLAVAHVISQTEVSLKIMLKYSRCGDKGMMVIVRSLINFQFKLKVEKLLLPCAEITADSFKHMSKAYNTFKPLKELDFTSNNIGPSGATVLANIFEVGSSLIKINLKNMRIDEGGAAKLIPHLANHKQLSELILSGNLLGSSGIKQLVKCVQRLQNLKVFRIRGVSGNTSADEAAIASLLDAVALRCHNLKKFDISCNSLSLAGAEAFGRALAALKHPQNVWVNKAKLTDEGMYQFANCLSSMTKSLVPAGFMVSHLELLDNDLHAEGVCQLVEAVNTGSLPVTRLYLGGNPLGPEGAIQLGRMLEFEHCQLRSLGLSKCNLGSKGAIILLHALSSNTSLDDINLTDNEIGKTNESDMSVFIDQLSKPSQAHSCTPNGSKLKWLCDTLKPNTHLKYLRISDNYFTGYGIEVLLAFLTVCQSLKYLVSRSCQICSDDLRYNHFQTTITTVSEVATSSQALFTHPELQKWNLENNKIEEDATTVFFKLAGTGCPQLSCISLQGNPAYGSLEAQGLNLEKALQNKV